MYAICQRATDDGRSHVSTRLTVLGILFTRAGILGTARSSETLSDRDSGRTSHHTPSPRRCLVSVAFPAEALNNVMRLPHLSRKCRPTSISFPRMPSSMSGATFATPATRTTCSSRSSIIQMTYAQPETAPGNMGSKMSWRRKVMRRDSEVLWTAEGLWMGGA